MLIDTHAHLNDEKLYPIIDDIIDNMNSDGIEHIINIGYDMPSSRISFDIAKKYEKVFGAVGIHPHDAKTACSAYYDEIIEMSKNPKIVAIGEIGLDYYYDLSEREVQKRVFVEQLELAHFVKKPISIHLRDAYGDMSELLKQNKSKLEYGVLLHCYSGSVETLKEYSKLYDAYFAFGGAITFKNAKKEDVVMACPIDRILVETDCPYMTPVPYRGQPNLPKYVSLVAQKLKEILPNYNIEQITTNNAKNFFGIK